MKHHKFVSRLPELAQTDDNDDLPATTTEAKIDFKINLVNQMIELSFLVTGGHAKL